ATIVALMVILGFLQLGAPSAQRKLRADAKRLQQLSLLTNAIHNSFTSHASQLPSSLDQLSGATFTDPVTGAPFEYHPQQGSHYQLCAVFAAHSPQTDQNQPFDGDPGLWNHPSGRHCFSFDAASTPQSPPYAYNPY
ncbi:MAG TPA: hypothetical protein VGR64_04155, partial [Terracidiphilus sp.]|nr:hypothetical protein [Terracidiphilus sp.]